MFYQAIGLSVVKTIKESGVAKNGPFMLARVQIPLWRAKSNISQKI